MEKLDEALRIDGFDAETQKEFDKLCAYLSVFKHRAKPSSPRYVTKLNEFQLKFMAFIDKATTNRAKLQIKSYISEIQSATTITRQKTEARSNETLTSELLYYYMAQIPLPFDTCERWHLSRLMKTMEIAAIKNDPKSNEKMSSHDWALKQSALNKARRLAAKSKG